jgi:5'-3' exonuclease
VTHRLLLDTSSLMYRAFFALPPSIKDPEGHQVNAVHGYLDFTSTLLATHHPDAAVHVFDHDWRPAPRVALYQGYKSTRAPDPKELPPQFDLLRDVLEAFGLPQAEAEGWEADDAIGALCAALRGNDRVDIVTGDRDLIQLVRDDAVRVLFTLRGVREVAVYDEASVEAKYGLPPSRYADFATLRGDPSDGLPGVPGVGQKTALALVQGYPDLDTILAEASREAPSPGPLKGNPGLRARIRAAAGYLEAMRQVVPVRADVDVRTWSGSRDDTLLDDLAERRNLKGPIRRLRAALGGVPA